jgi:hypothetical protein
MALKNIYKKTLWLTEQRSFDQKITALRFAPAGAQLARLKLRLMLQELMRRQAPPQTPHAARNHLL